MERKIASIKRMCAIAGLAAATLVGAGCASGSEKIDQTRGTPFSIDGDTIKYGGIPVGEISADGRTITRYKNDYTRRHTAVLALGYETITKERGCQPKVTEEAEGFTRTTFTTACFKK